MSEFETFFASNTAIQLLWEKTIYQVALLFGEAEKRVRCADGQTKHTSRKGWWRNATQRINGKNGYQIPEETAVSEAIIEEMQEIKRELILDPKGRGPDLDDIDALEFAAEVPRRQKKGIGRHAKPTDFRFYRSGLGDVELRIEAKVVLRDKDIEKHYLGKEGIGRFSDTEEPYTDELVGGMVAYTVSDDRVTWQGRIDTGLSTASIPKFDHTLPQTGQRILCSKVPYTHGKTPPQSEVLVFHLVLELDCAPSAR